MNSGNGPVMRSMGSARAAAPALVLIVAGLAGLTAARFARAEAAGVYLVVSGARDRAGATALIHDAGGGVLSLGRFTRIALAASDDPGFATAARLRGAWMVLPAPVGLGCTTTGAGDDR